MAGLVGQKVVEIRRLTDAEMKREGWEDWGSAWPNPVALVFQNGDVVYASADDEGNGPGYLFGASKKGETFFLCPPEEVGRL